MSEQCRTCHQWIFTDAHRCPPAWLVWCPEDGGTPEEGRTFHAIDAEGAAEEWAELDDQDGDYLIAGQRHTPTVCVQSASGGEIKQFKVSGETVPQYSAEEMEASDGAA